MGELERERERRKRRGRERERRGKERVREKGGERGRDSKILKEKKKNNPKKSHVFMEDFFMLKFH